MLIPQHITIAQSRSSVLVVPSCPKSQGPFTCLECAGGLVLKQEKIKVFHFAHRHLSPTCSGGGESARHKAAKLLVEKYCSRLIFKGNCITGTHTIARQYPNSSAQQEYRYDLNKLYSADVALFSKKGVLGSIVEVHASHATTGHALESRRSCVGANNVWEVSAVETLKHQSELFTTANAVEIPSLLHYEVDECTPVCHRVVRETEELAEIAHYREMRLRSFRIIGPVVKRYSSFLAWKRRLHLCLRARSYHKAVDHIDCIPRWKEPIQSQFRELVVREWCTWINSLVRKFEFVAAERLLSAPLLVIEESVLAGLKINFVSRVRASRVLKCALQKHLVYVRWTLRERKVARKHRMYRKYQHWVVQPAVVIPPVSTPMRRCRDSHITDFFRQPKCARVS